jgi:hypothetical protein
MERESEYNERVLGVSINQDASCAAVVTRKGFIIYNIADQLEVGNIHALKNHHAHHIHMFVSQKRFCDFSEGMRIAEMLHVTSLLALVGSGDAPMYVTATSQLVVYTTAYAQRFDVILFLHSIHM